jgi:hypothetical protein
VTDPKPDNEQHEDDEGRHLLPTDAEILASLVVPWPPNI